jgi:hypothetical protein
MSSPDVTRFIGSRLNATRVGQAEKAPRLLAGLIARQAHSANVRPERINRARCRYADLTDQTGAAISFATHATVVVIDEESWNPIELGIALRRSGRNSIATHTSGARRAQRLALRESVSRENPGAAFDNLLGRPFGRRVACHADVQDFSIGVPNHEEDMERLEQNRLNAEKSRAHMFDT